MSAGQWLQQSRTQNKVWRRVHVMVRNDSAASELMAELPELRQCAPPPNCMDEVFLIASSHCPRCKNGDPAKLFAKSVNDLHRHLVGQRKVEMLLWADRLLNAATMGVIQVKV